MRAILLACLLAWPIQACSREAHAYPDTARTAFHRTCPANDALCVCTWERLTRSMTFEEYEAALDRFRSEGLMDPRIAHARATCVERRH